MNIEIQCLYTAITKL